MQIEFVAGALAVSLLFYCVFGGADFGGGILELFCTGVKKEEQREIINHALAPVWEANHMWIVLAVVILFNGFPSAFSEISTFFHIPLLIMLVGIILRGCAFSFRNYDAVKDKSQKYYTAIFIFSSYLTPLMLGMIIGGLFLGQTPQTVGAFFGTFVGPWLNLFGFAIGLFVCALFSFLAAVYLVGETQDRDLVIVFSKKARIANALAVVAGALVFLAAEHEGFSLLSLFLSHGLAVVFMGLATVILIPLWITLHKRWIWIPRILAALQIFFVLGGWGALQYPALLRRASHSVTIYGSAAPQTTLNYLIDALAIGGVLIFPALLYMMVIFKSQKH